MRLNRGDSTVDRVRNGAESNEPFLASLIPGPAVKPFSRHIRGASRGGRPRRSRTQEERKIIEAWESKRHSTHKDVADLFGVKVKDVTRLIRSHQQAARRNHG
jgi:hypothetical protein